MTVYRNDDPPETYDDEDCAHCGAYLPEYPKEPDWPWYGFCDAECALRLLIVDIAAGRGNALIAKDLTHYAMAERAINEITQVWREHNRERA